MVVEVRKLAELIGNEIVLEGPASKSLIHVLTNCEPYAEPHEPLKWFVKVLIGEGANQRVVRVDLAQIFSLEEYHRSRIEPVFIMSNDRNIRLPYAIFRDRFFSVFPDPDREVIIDEAVLRIKKKVYAEEAEIISLKSYVANVEAAIEYQRTGPKRAPLPDDVKMVVWARDGGACTRCGSNEQLHFDHIIPVSKGGGGGSENIQLLCQSCNLRKSDKIAF